jgi:glycosyltransferase involved in cell wall biosynthesis
MRILHLSQYFYPEPGAVQVRAEAMACSLANKGHQVTVLTEMPNHPLGVIYPEYKGRFFSKEIYKGLEIVRVWVLTSRNKNQFTRMAFYASYMFNAIIRGLFLFKKFDIIYANSPPLLVGTAAAVLGLVRRKPLVFEVQDLWPESAVDMGELTNKNAIRIATFLEVQCYKQAKQIIVVSEGIRDRLIERGIPQDKLVMIENGSNTDLFRPLPDKREEYRSKLELNNKFIVFYGGIIGLAQGLEIIVESARELQNNQNIHFLMVGDGPRRKSIEELIRKYNLSNITFLPGQPLAVMPSFLAASDVALAPLRDLPVFQGVRPTKIFDAWACQRPVIVCAKGEPRRIVENAMGGICVEPENASDLTRAIMKLYKNQSLGKELGNNGYAFVSEHYSLQSMANKLENLFKQTLNIQVA